MFTKVILSFCFHGFLIKTVAGQQPTDTPFCHITQKQFSEFSGPDLCAPPLADSTELYKTACNYVAIKEKRIRDGSLPFKCGYPHCMNAKLQTYDSQKNKSKVIDIMLVNCANDLGDFPIGKGQSPNGVAVYACENNLCEALYDVPDAVLSYSGPG